MKRSFLDRYMERKGKPADVRVITLIIQILNQLKLMLSGYKTYIVAGIAIISAVGGYLVGDITLVKTLELVFEGVIAMTLRNGITTDNKK